MTKFESNIECSVLPLPGEIDTGEEQEDLIMNHEKLETPCAESCPIERRVVKTEKLYDSSLVIRR